MISSDYFGNRFKWFIGVVKDTNDSNNRVRVRIFGIHPDDDFEQDEVPNGTSTTIVDNTTATTVTPTSTITSPQTPTTSQSATGQDTTYTFKEKTTLPATTADNTNFPLPNSGQLEAKLSPNFTLGQLSVKASSVSQSTIKGFNDGYLSQDAIQNLQNLCFNVLEPIKAQYPNLVINSGWRWMSSPADRSSSGGNHPKGYAADIHVNNMSCLELANWILNNLKGRFNLLLLEHMGNTSWVHIQFGGTSGQGSLTNPLWGTYFVTGSTTDKIYYKFVERN